MSLILKEKLKVLRTEGGFTQQQVADAINVDRVSYNRYENGNRVPSNEVTVALAIFFDCTTDYLLGKTDERNLVHYEIGKYEGMKIAVDIVEEAIKDGLSPEEIQRFVEIAKQLKKD